MKIKNHNILWSAVGRQWPWSFCQFKMPGKCKFLNKWLEQPQYHAWLRNSPDIQKAHCKSCNKSFYISSLGESALQSYERYFYIFISAMCERIWKGELKQFWALRKKEAKCVGKNCGNRGNYRKCFPDWVQAFSLEER